MGFTWFLYVFIVLYRVLPWVLHGSFLEIGRKFNPRPPMDPHGNGHGNCRIWYVKEPSQIPSGYVKIAMFHMAIVDLPMFHMVICQFAIYVGLPEATRQRCFFFRIYGHLMPICKTGEPVELCLEYRIGTNSSTNQYKRLNCHSI